MNIKALKKPHLRLATLILGLLLVVCSFAFVNSYGWARLAINTVGYLGLFAVIKLAGLSFGDLGLAKNKLKKGLVYGLVTVGAIFIGFLAVFLVDKAIFQDPRYHQGFLTAVYAVLVLLPAKTVIFEELAFRGIIPSLAIEFKKSRRFATLVSALAFGLWHISSATKVGGYHLAGWFTVPSWAVVIGIFIATFVAGIGLCWLRWRSGSLLAPMIAHWFINGFGIILAAISWR